VTVPLDIDVQRLPERLKPDSGRVILRPFRPGDEQRIRNILQRILDLPIEQVEMLVPRLRSEFGSKHPDLEDAVADHFEDVAEFLPTGAQPDENRRWLMGAYCTMEYAIESAALFNPSMVPRSDQRGSAPGSTSFLMSLRAVGEGHISSIVFRTGTIDRECKVTLDPPSPYARTLKVEENRSFEKRTFLLKIIEMGAYTDLAGAVFDRLNETFDMHELNEAVEAVRSTHEQPAVLRETVDNILSLARSNYHIRIPKGHDPSEIVIFPSAETESHGIEDVRLVLFADEDGGHRIYGTYTAYNGFHIVPQLMDINDYMLKVHTLSGLYAQNKGMALFPRKLGDRYAMISRLDNENIFLMYSENVRFWNSAEVIQTPKFPWELIQLGNCGSPLETDAGWLLLTHGVGAMRRYCIGATLLNHENPARVIGQTREPILVPRGEERTGYVPNVVYSCGGMIHNDRLIIPYGMSDIATGFASVSLADLLRVLKG